MPEGPSILILKEAVRVFAGHNVLSSKGSTNKVDFARLNAAKVLSFKSWGKHFLICFKHFTVRIHFYCLDRIALMKRRREEFRV